MALYTLKRKPNEFHIRFQPGRQNRNWLATQVRAGQAPDDVASLPVISSPQSTTDTWVPVGEASLESVSPT